MSSPKTRAKGSSSLQPPSYITGTGIHQHAMRLVASFTRMLRKIWMKMFSICLRTLSFWVPIGLVTSLKRWPNYSRKMLRLLCATRVLLLWPPIPGLART
ncbi:hypothetical protein L3X38_011112 [Prunus dulcis]|uniref:Uncharacterized protein n=1 Tax=Prunus dulcis TaxID=3755 RepID=A0AAD4ZF37_PRUDU|nr:hypothetical protein L3X38_011112 [Prunus dulcis]